MSSPDAELLFDEEAHRYTLDGRTLPSVTQIIAPLFAKAAENWTEAGRDFGKHVHLVTELYDRDDLDEGSLDPALVPYLSAWQRFRADTGFAPTHIEHRLYHPDYLYAGTIDRIGLLNGTPTIIDIKSGASHPAYGVQLAGYAFAWDAIEKGYEGDLHRYVVGLRNDGTYRLERQADPDDYRTFLACLNVHNWKENHG